LQGKLMYVPLSVATQPINGECLCNRWWIVHLNRGLAFYWVGKGCYRMDEPAPQCNANEHITRRLMEQLWPGHECRFLPVVYLGHARRAVRGAVALKAGDTDG